jgi:hypothetical protein
MDKLVMLYYHIRLVTVLSKCYGPDCTLGDLRARLTHAKNEEIARLVEDHGR